MGKLIHSHYECGYKLMGMCLFTTMGKHKLLSAKKECNPKGEELFPNCCPLEDGVTIDQFKRAIKLI